MRSIEFHGSNLKSGVLAVGFCCLLGCGVVLLATVLLSSVGPGYMIMPMVLGSGLIVVGLLGLYVAIIQLVRRGAIVTIDGEGILDVRNGLALIPWADIKALRMTRRKFWSGSKYGIDYIGVYLKTPAPYLLRLPGWKRRLTAFGLRQGMPFAEISFLGLTPGAQEAANYLRETSRLTLPSDDAGPIGG
jgi:hypothetical protein